MKALLGRCWFQPACRHVMKRADFDQLHRQLLNESNDWSENLLAEATGEPQHPMFKTKREAMRWSVQHEFIDAGQIGLLRRLLGATPLR